MSNGRRVLRWATCILSTALAAQPGLATAQAAPSPVVGSPADEVPAEEASSEESPSAESPSAESPSEEAPSAESPVEESPAGEAPQEVVLEAGADLSTGITGRVYGVDRGDGLESAPVLIEGQGRLRTVLAGADGTYRAYVPPGRYTVSSYYDLYHGGRIAGLRVARGRFLEVDLVLDPIAVEDVSVEELEIAYEADTTSEQAQLNLRREQTTVQDSVSSQEMGRSGDGDASGAARRVVGVSTDGGRLVVRGLGGRYSQTLVNGVAVPSTDPDVPGIQLDIFPAGMIDSLSVMKTARPDIPGDFAGGVLLIETTSYPRERVIEAGLSFGVNTQSTFRSRLDYHGGNLDWLGVDDGTRTLPGAIPDDRGRLDVCRRCDFTFEELEGLAEELPNEWDLHRATALPAIGVDLTLGDRYELGHDVTVGYLASVGYDHASVRETGVSRPRPNVTVEDDGSLSFDAFNDFARESGADEVSWGGLLTAGASFGSDHDLRLLSMVNRSMTDEAQLQTGIGGELGDYVEKWQLDFVARQLFFTQLLGDHRNLGNTRTRLRYDAFVATGTRSEPDRRTVTYGPQGDTFRWLEKSSSGERFYSDLSQRTFGGGTSYRFPLWPEGWGTLGARAQVTERDFENRRFRMVQERGVTDQTLYGQDAEILFSEEGIGTLTRLREFTREDDSYHSEQRMGAAYALLETPIVDRLRMAGGARVEIFDQFVESFDPLAPPAEDNADPSTDARTDRTDVDVLPSAAFVLRVTDDVFVRAAYGATVARPQVRELAPYQYYDFVRDRNVSGNPDLDRTFIHNADLRFEWFLGGTDLLAATAFYKHFDAPIELVIQDPMTYDAAFQNADSAQAIGGEVEMRLGLERFAPALEHWSLGANLALIRSEVSLREEDRGAVQGSRRMFGQSPYVTNVSLRLDHPGAGLTASLVYNVVGPRISEVGVRASDTLILPNVVEQPFHSLDLVASWEVTSHLSLKLKLKNLLFETRDFRQGSFLVQRTEPGMTVSAGLGLTY